MSDMIQNIFSKIIAFILAVIASLSGNLADAPEIKMVKDVNTTSSTIVIQVVNDTGDAYVTLNNFTLEKKIGEDWVKLESKESYEPSKTVYYIDSRQDVEFTIYITNVFDKTLDVGKYRLNEELILCDKDYEKAMAAINAFVPDETLYPDAASKAAAKEAFKEATFQSLDKKVYSVEFSVNN